MTTLRTRTTFAALAGLTLVGALAGCSTAASPDTGTVPDSGTDSGTGSGTTSSGAYADGTYSASGSYQAPSGTESVEVTLTLADSVIVDVTVVGDATDPQAKQHQGEFVGGIAGVVVGKDIDSLQVDKVGGSSLTSGGFNKAIEEIKADASA